MLVIRVELHSAITGAVTEIARMHLWNTGSGTETRGNYEGETYNGDTSIALDRRVVQKRGSVRDYPRKERHVWHLVAKMLNAMGYGK